MINSDEDIAARDAELSAGDSQPDDHGNEARPDAGKEGVLARRDAGEALTDIARTFGVSHTTIGRLTAAAQTV